MKQSVLIQRIIKAVGFQNAISYPAPATMDELQADINEPGPQESCNTRLSIAMDVHQCIRCRHNPKTIH